MIDHSTRSIEIPKYIIVKKKATEELAPFLEIMRFKNVCVATQENLLDLMPDIQKAVNRNDYSIFYVEERPNLSHLMNRLDSVHDLHPDALVGIGGGSVLDTVKFFAHILNIPLILVPTLASNDGICSPVVSLKLENGRSDSFRARMRSPCSQIQVSFTMRQRSIYMLGWATQSQMSQPFSTGSSQPIGPASKLTTLQRRCQL